MMIKLGRGSFGAYTLDSGDDQILIQSDYERPGIASTFGWDISSVPGEHLDAPGHGCYHDSTDGTVQCAGCGQPASVFIAAATDYLDSRIGVSVEDPGYFGYFTERN